MKSRNQKLRLIEFRSSLGLTKLELSKLLGIDQEVWSHYETGGVEPRLSQWLKMKSSAEQNNIPLDKSLFYQESKKEDSEITFTTNSLLELRTHLGLSQEVIAKESGITYRTWGRYERGETELLASTYFKIRDYAQQRGIDLLPPSLVSIKKADKPQVIFANECFQKPSLRLCLQR